MNNTALFSYIQGNSFFHKIPAEAKVFILLLCPPLLFLTDIQTSLICMSVIIFFALFSGISLKIQLRDIKPILFYSIFLLFIEFISNTITLYLDKTTSFQLNSFLNSCLPSKKTILLILHLITTIQFTSLFFKTTTSIALKNALSNIEKTISFGKSSGEFSNTFSLFLNFIPTIFGVWKQIDRSWTARGGRSTVSKIFALLPVFISISLKKAHQTLLALENRK